MRIQPVQGSGMNAGYDAATKSITVSNEGNTPFLYFRVNNKIPIDQQDSAKGYYRFFDFYEVYWDGNDFIKLEGGLSATYDSRETCPKLYAVPYDIDEPSNIGNFTGNVGVTGQGLVYIGRYRGVDSGDGRDVYEFFRSLDPSSKVIFRIDSELSYLNQYYSAVSSSNIDQSSTYQTKYWARDINGSELSYNRSYIGYFVGQSYDPYPGNPELSDPRPVLASINSQIAGPTGITVVTDVSCTGGTISATYGTFYPSEQAYITQDSKKTFISLTDTPVSYAGAANYYLAVNSGANGIVFTAVSPSASTTPSISFINLNDCPSSYPSNPGTGTLVLTKSSTNSIVFTTAAFVTGIYSVQPLSSSINSSMSFKLVNDKQYPGENMYYGTDSNGVKGWYPLPQ